MSAYGEKELPHMKRDIKKVEEKLFAQVMGVLFLAMGVLGFVVPSIGTIEFNTTHNLIHVLFGLAGLYVGYGDTTWVRDYVRVVGIGFLLFGLLGFMTKEVGPIRLEPVENLMHLLIGILGLVTGYFVTPAYKPSR